MRSKDRAKAMEMRIKEKLGYGEISKRLNVPKSTLSSWLKDMPLSPTRVLELRRNAWTKGEASRELFRQTMRRKRDERNAQVYEVQRNKLGVLSDQSLFVAGLMLYLAEGDKKSVYSIGLANTDPQIIRFFIWWLSEFLEISKSRVRIQLHIYESMNISNERSFWRKVTGVPFKQFYKDQVRMLRPNSFSYPESFRHGTCKVYVHGLDYKMKLSLSIKAFLDTYYKSRA